MELTDLKVFLAVAAEGNVSRAAERLEYVQSNVTARIRKLETELGVPLFHRHPKGVTLTDKGTVFRDYALTIVNLAEESIKAVREKSYPSGPLAIGVVETATCGTFMDTLAKFQNRYPDVSLSIVTGVSPDLVSMVMNHQLDGAFVSGEVRSPMLATGYVMRDELVLLCKDTGSGYPDLHKTKWAVHPKGCPFRKVLEEWLESIGIPFAGIIEISSLETLLTCVKSGLAATVLPTSVLSGEYQSLAAYAIPEQYGVTSTSLIHRKDRFSSKAFAAFAEMINHSGL
ncbi:LysR family transcriptional regulator [Brevibacillus brevis]|uniref:LysR family transcriptional regulator n=1 Tax=Brevibacillus brevis TaxID=1393 RepID=A0ABY9TBJ9_BREBE|nr:LysR family transcriptional regulator [Brevibacillus brevis]WNC16287.1 LysR family transcriptional regulator [Brevibacillus brevis]